MIETTSALEAFCEHVREVGRFAFDTEFIGESSYQPLLCLVQVGTVDRVELIDPFAVENLGPLWEIIADPGIETICHAGDQDFAIVWQRSKRKPAAIFDAQIGAGVTGLGYPLAYWRLVELFCGVELDKAHTYSAWNQRPLSREQFKYAVDDVRYLMVIRDGLHEKMEAAGHTAWMREACDDLATAAAVDLDPRKVFLKIKGANTLDGLQLSVLREVTAVREQMAFENDVPARTMLKDEALMDIAVRMPKRESDLLAIRSIPRNELVSYGGQILQAIERGRHVPVDQRPSLPPPPDDSLEIKRLAEQLSAAAHVICMGQSVTPALVMSQAQTLGFARRLMGGRTVEDHPFMMGWVKECLGKPLLAFFEGRLKLEVAMEGGAAGSIRVAFNGG
jgi:ribonuclease D